MAGIPPIREERVPFKKIRKALASIYRQLRRCRPIEGGLLQIEPNGFRVLSPVIPPHEIPRLLPRISSNTTSSGVTTQTLYITPGYLSLPYATGNEKEKPLNHLYPLMPKLDGTLLDAEAQPSFELANAESNYTYLRISLIAREVTIGETVILTDDVNERGSTGASVWIQSKTHAHEIVEDLAIPDNHDHDGNTLGTAPDPMAQVDLANVAYHSYASEVPEFFTNTTGFPSDTLTSHYIPWCLHTVDGDGNLAAAPVIYWRGGDRDYYPPNYVKSTVTGGHRKAGGSASDDASVNPS